MGSENEESFIHAASNLLLVTYIKFKLTLHVPAKITQKIRTCDICVLRCVWFKFPVFTQDVWISHYQEKSTKPQQQRKFLCSSTSTPL